MRRTIILTTVLAVSAAVLGACEGKTETPNKPVSSPTPVTVASPAASPSPIGSPVKPGSTPEVKKTDDKKPVDGKDANKELKTPPAATPKTK